MSHRVLVLALVACGGSPPHPTPTSGGSAGSAAPADPDAAPLPLDPAIRHGVLPNGMTYYVQANKKPEKRVQLWLAVDAGSLLETDDQRGMAHMVEHLAFDGTKHFPKRDIQDFVEKSGMKFGADLNAFTSWDETVYQLQVPSDAVSRGLDVLRDWAGDVSFEPQAAIDERKIIEEERRFRNNVGYRMAQQTFPVEYQGSHYAERMPIGTTPVIMGATGDKLKAFYQAWYRPDLMAVIAVGDFDPAAIEQEIKTKLGAVPAAKPDAPKRTPGAFEANHAPRMVVARDAENAVDIVSLSYQVGRRGHASSADFRRSLVEHVFTHLLSERFAIIAKRPTAAWTGATAHRQSQIRPVEELVLLATAKDGKATQAIADLATELARVRQHGFSDAEIQQGVAAIAQQASEAARETDTRDSGDVADEMLRNYTEHVSMAGPKAELELAKRYLPTIKNADLVGLAKALTGAGRVVVIRAPATGAVPTEKDVGDQITAADKPVGEWQAVDTSAPLIASEPAPGKITKKQPRAQGVTEWTLSNGARVFVKPTTFKNDEVKIVAVSSGGLSQVKDADFPQAKFAAQVANAGSFGNYDADAIKAKLAGKKVAVEALLDSEQERVEAVCSPNDLEPALQLVYAAFTSPRRDEAAFAQWKAQQTQIASFIAANAEAKFFLDALDFLFDGNQRVPIPIATTKALAAVTLDGALAQYKARFANAADFDFVVVGAVDPAKLEPLVERYLASLPATKAKREVVKDSGLRVKKGTVAHTFKAGNQDKSITLLLASSDLKWSPDLEADVTILSAVLDIEMLALLREKLGGTYTVRVQVEADRNPPNMTSTLVSFESAPGNAATMQQEAWKMLDALATAPVKAETIAKVREQIKKAHDTELAENDYWERVLVRHARYGDDLDKAVAIDRALGRVTAAQIQQTARQVIDKRNRATLTLLPEK